MFYRGNTKTPVKTTKVYRRRWEHIEKKKKERKKKYLMVFEIE